MREQTFTTSSSATRAKAYDGYREPFKRSEPKRPRKVGPIVAWDIETDNIPGIEKIVHFNRKEAVRSRTMEILEEQRMTYAALDVAIADLGGVVASVVWNAQKKRYTIAGEFSDVPRRLLKRPALRPGESRTRIDGNLDEIADTCGWSEDAILEALAKPRLGIVEARSQAEREIPPIEDIIVGVKYLTAYGADVRVSSRVDDDSLGDYFVEHLFTKERTRTRYVAWNANRFDTLYLLRSLRRHADRFIIRPFVAGQGGLRGARVTLRSNPKLYWDLCDGIAMTGCAMSLADFTRKFVPDRMKLEGAIDFSKEQFDPNNPLHVEYAERDAEALYLAMVEVERIAIALTGRPLRMTIGALAIRYLQANIPKGVMVFAPPEPLSDKLFAQGMRGGYVYVTRQFDGPAWQYDQNQAYGAAMRDARLPCGRCVAVDGEVAGAVGFYNVTISRSERSPIPFYCKDEGGPVECYGDEPMETFVASVEVETLRRWGWSVDVHDGWVFEGSFNVAPMIEKLENIRMNDRGGPNGAVGTMAKYIGCNAYGKTTEQLSSESILIADRPPEDEDGWAVYRPEDEAFEGFWCRVNDESERRNYHRPQLGAAITAHVRMVLFDAIMEAPDGFLKCDTDSVCFDRPVDHLEVHRVKYGTWKPEYPGQRFLIVGKKVYGIVGVDGKLEKVICKGLNTKRISLHELEAWIHSGKPPRQAQVQSLGWRRGLPKVRYRAVERRGTDFRKVAPHLFVKDGE